MLGKHEHRNSAKAWIVFQSSQDLQAIQLRRAQIEQYRIGNFPYGGIQATLAVRDALNGKPLAFKIRGTCAREKRVAVSKENFCACLGHHTVYSRARRSTSSTVVKPSRTFRTAS